MWSILSTDDLVEIRPPQHGRGRVVTLLDTAAFKVRITRLRPEFGRMACPLRKRQHRRRADRGRRALMAKKKEENRSRAPRKVLGCAGTWVACRSWQGSSPQAAAADSGGWGAARPPGMRIRTSMGPRNRSPRGWTRPEVPVEVPISLDKCSGSGAPFRPSRLPFAVVCGIYVASGGLRRLGWRRSHPCRGSPPRVRFWEGTSCRSTA